MGLSTYIVYFLVGGSFTVLIVGLEAAGHQVLSGFAALIPVFTLVAYLFIGESVGGVAVGRHAWFVLAGTLVAWVPYMVAVAYLSPRIGAYKAILIGLSIFFVLAFIYITAVGRFKFFQ